MDRGANGCIFGTDVRIVKLYNEYVDLNGIDEHTVRNLQLAEACAYVRTNRGPAILHIHQGAVMSDGKTILSPAQLEAFGCKVHDRAKRVSGKDPYFETPCGRRIPMAVRSGLLYNNFRPPTDAEMKDPSIPRIHVTSPHSWDPTVLDSVPASDWYKEQPLDVPLDDDFPLDSDGFLKESEEDALESDDRKYQSIDRRGIMAVTARMIASELYDSDCESDSESSYVVSHPPSRDCHVQTRAQRRRTRSSGNGEKVTPSPVVDELPEADTGDATVPDLMDRCETDDDDSDIESDDESDDESVAPFDEPQPKYNNKARHHTGLEHPPKSSKLPKDPAKQADVSEYRRFFPGVTDETIKRTFKATTQYGSKGAVKGTTLRNQHVSPNPILNIPRRNEDVATDTIYGSVPAVDDGSTAAQIFIGRTSRYRTLRPAGTSDASYARNLMDEIRKLGAMNRIDSDNAKAQVSKRVKDIMRLFAIDDRHSEPHKGNQNPAELGWRDTKSKIQHLLDTKNAPAKCWLLAGQYVCFIQNHIAIEQLGWKTPAEWMLGYTPDVSVLLQFEFWEPVYYKKYDAAFPEDPTECVGRFVGIAEDVGHGMTYKILTDKDKVISRAVVRTARKGGEHTNWKADEAAPSVAPKPKPSPIKVETVGIEDHVELDETPESEIFYNQIRKDVAHSNLPPDVLEDGELPTIDVTNLLNRTFIANPDDSGQQTRAKVISAVPVNETDADGVDQIYKFRCKHGDAVFEEIVSYNKMLEWCDRDLDKDDMYRIDTILAHRKSNTRSKWELLVGWGNGEKTWHDMGFIFNDDPVTVAVYAMIHDLLGTAGWKRCKPYVKNSKKFARMVHQRRLKNFRNRPVYKYGFQVPRNHEEAVFIDEKNGNTKWQDSEKLEIGQLDEYNTFKSLGKNAPVPPGFQKIPCHMVYDVKHDGRHKSRFVAGGHRTETPTESVYSGVVSLQGIRLITFIAELNDLELWGTDVGNAYLESYTKEKVCFIAGPEFGELEGHTMQMIKAQYGLKSSGKCWHDRLFDVLSDMGFKPSKAESDIWMRDCGDHYEYIACYVDDLLIASRNPKAITDSLEAAPHNFKLKGTGEVKYHLGCTFARDSDGTLTMGPQKYCERVKAQYVALFGENPSTKVTSPIEKNDHPELDMTPLLDASGVTKYQSLIGALQWAISLGRFDIGVAVMSLSSFRAAPRVGHLERLKRVACYLCKMDQGCIRVRTDEPDYSMLEHRPQDWEKTVYGNVSEVLPTDAPEARGKRVVLTTYVDANLYHDWSTGRAVTGVLHFVNQTPFEWFTKKQATVETATYGSEFVAAKIAVEQIMASRVTLRYLGVPVHGATYMFGDNGSVCTNATLPHSPLKKRHHALSYHFVREAIAAKIIQFHHMPGELNPADILTKHWGYSQIWPVLKSVLFWSGDTAKLLDTTAAESGSGE